MWWSLETRCMLPLSVRYEWTSDWMNDWEADEDGKLHEILVYWVAPRKFCVLNRRKIERNEVKDKENERNAISNTN